MGAKGLTLETPALQNSRLQLSLSLTLTSFVIITEVKEVGIYVNDNNRVGQSKEGTCLMGFNNFISSQRWFLSCRKRRTKSPQKESKLWFF